MNVHDANLRLVDGSEWKQKAPACRVLIVGEHDLGNTILRDYLDDHFEYASVIDSTEKDAGSVSDAPVVFLVDHRRHDDGPAHCVCRRCQRGTKSAICAIFNIPRELRIDDYLACPHLHGVFYRDTHPSELIRGIKGMLKGQHWIPRTLMAKALSNLLPSKAHSANFLDTKKITKRERHVLHMIKSGATNQEIASRLNLSEHTIKTHVYNIFRKLEVSNRIQAVNLMSSKAPDLLDTSR